jgi:hypothetical protein
MDLPGAFVNFGDDWSVFLTDDGLGLLEDFNFDIGFEQLPATVPQDSSEPTCDATFEGAELFDSSILDPLNVLVKPSHNSFQPDDCANDQDSETISQSPDLSSAPAILHDAVMSMTKSDSSPQNPRKRAWLDSMVVFSAIQNTEVAEKKRKSFSPLRRKEVAMNRHLGVCLQCRIRKEGVSNAIAPVSMTR